MTCVYVSSTRVHSSCLLSLTLPQQWHRRVVIATVIEVITIFQLAADWVTICNALLLGCEKHLHLHIVPVSWVRQEVRAVDGGVPSYQVGGASGIQSIWHRTWRVAREALQLSLRGFLARLLGSCTVWGTCFYWAVSVLLGAVRGLTANALDAPYKPILIQAIQLNLQDTLKGGIATMRYSSPGSNCFSSGLLGGHPIPMSLPASTAIP